jgi:hypothetical protein
MPGTRPPSVFPLSTASWMNSAVLFGLVLLGFSEVR